ncbi:cytochrome b/b6 domain-containing protein [Paenarthrobacter nicotinovorans]|uniref:cytochrome b/b6 domain-containing protein n=1 Tax=Paenarthrobacter nicotinovorans TaxID=29320 RepID=UPI003D67ACDD
MATQQPTPKGNPRKTWRYAVLGLGLVVLAGLLVLTARWLVTLPEIKDFLNTYPGSTDLPRNAPVGIPAWLGWQHFFNFFLMVLIIQSGLRVRTTDRPAAYWTRNNSGLIKTKNPPTRISLDLWFHLTLDILWLVNGLLFVILLLATGQWMRVVPTTWETFPNALSAALQYASLDWPTEDGWTNYNSLQMLAYFATIFIAAPLAALTGIRMSGAWPRTTTRLNKIYTVELARAVHFPVMLYFVVFIIMHVTLVFATGALRNLNHMYGGQDQVNWFGFIIFSLSLLLTAGVAFAARPVVLAPLAGIMGKVGRK